MEVTLGSGYRITIPREIRDQLHLKENTKLQLNIQDNKIILSADLTKDILNSKEEIKVEEIKEELSTKEIKPVLIDRPKEYKKLTINGIKIESNLEEGEKFSRKVYSDCKLVIRTKRSYLEKFCSICQGELAYQYGVLDHPCKYINIPERIEIEEPKKENPVKSIVKKLTDNISKLDKKLDDKIDIIEQEFP